MTRIFEEDGGGGAPTNVVGTGAIAGTDGSHPKSVMNRKRVLRRRQPKTIINESAISLLPQILDTIDTSIRLLQSIDVQGLMHQLGQSLPKDGQTMAQIANELTPSQIKKRGRQIGELSRNLIKGKPLTGSISSLEMAKKVLLARNKIEQPADREMTKAPRKRKKRKKNTPAKRKRMVREIFSYYMSRGREGE